MTGLFGTAAAEAHYETWAGMTQYLPGGYAREGAAGTRLVVSTIPDPTLNVVNIEHALDLREVEAFAQEVSATGLPWSIRVRGDVDPELKELAVRYGRTGTSTSPLMWWDAESLPTQPVALPEGTKVRMISGADSAEFGAALQAGFGLPADMARMLAMPGLLDDPNVTAFVLDLDGEVVATGMNAMAGESVGMYSGSVPPRYRGNGYYRALVTTRLAYAVERGARHAVSTNSRMSRPLYESLGFRVAETWTYLVPSQ
jgi:GNAT superfamily N-acetyltransferase